MLKSDYSDAYIVVKRLITVTDSNDNAYNKKLTLKIKHHLLTAFQKLIIHSLVMWKI